jgi:hypothetical protein
MEKRRAEYEQRMTEEEDRRKQAQAEREAEYERLRQEREKKAEEAKIERKIMFTRVSKLNEFLKLKFLRLQSMDQQLQQLNQYQTFDAVEIFREIDGLNDKNRGFITVEDL